MNIRFTLLLVIATTCYSAKDEKAGGGGGGSKGGSGGGGGAVDGLSRPDIIEPEVLAPNQGLGAGVTPGPGHCRLADTVFAHGQLIHTTLACYKVRCGGGRLRWVADAECCVGSEIPRGSGGGSDGGSGGSSGGGSGDSAPAPVGRTSALMPPGTRQATPEVCQHAVCAKGRWTIQPDADRCCEHEHKWYPVGSTRPMQGGPCTYSLCHAGRWERHYNTSCCFDTIGWHTEGTVLFTADPCRTKTCHGARWTQSDSCCKDPDTGAKVATGDLISEDNCRYRLCQETRWLERTAFGCCQRDGRHYEHGAAVNVAGSWCQRDRCVDGAWHVVSRRKVGDGRCRAGWGRLGHRCVIRSEEQRTYAEAKAWCQKQGGYLLSIRNKQGWTHAEQAANATGWIGLRGYQTAAGRLQWRWDDATPLTAHVLWAPHEPGTRPGHRCAFVQRGRAVSADCEQKHAAYCATTDCRTK